MLLWADGFKNNVGFTEFGVRYNVASMPVAGLNFLSGRTDDTLSLVADNTDDLIFARELGATYNDVVVGMHVAYKKATGNTELLSFANGGGNFLYVELSNNELSIASNGGARRDDFEVSADFYLEIKVSFTTNTVELHLNEVKVFEEVLVGIQQTTKVFFWSNSVSGSDYLKISSLYIDSSEFRGNVEVAMLVIDDALTDEWSADVVSDLLIYDASAVTPNDNPQDVKFAEPIIDSIISALGFTAIGSLSTSVSIEGEQLTFGVGVSAQFIDGSTLMRSTNQEQSEVTVRMINES